MKVSGEYTDPEKKDIAKQDDETLDETGADHTGSNNTDENSEGRKEGKSFYEKKREVEPGSENKDEQK
ncbi:MAG: hypothetical protein H0W61_09995 [Bacteroidetes bacterium]|nr:hypothetical protein [Bacteroidota bacterium]